ncbi:MAG: polysaccharide biosynthesis/export family protein [Bacteroidales bacterium]|nr:polysaccharide biosynthesis/export family protein [Bacteroidales bacterium]
MKRVLHGLLIAVVGMTFLSSCQKPQVQYFTDADNVSGTIKTPTEIPIRLRAEDKIAIIVNCKDPEISNLFNLPYSTRRIGQATSYGSSLDQGISGYTVDKNGDIDFPVIGKLHVAGLTREEVSALVKNELAARDQVKDAVVTVEFMNLRFSVLGEVKTPGIYDINKDVITIIDAISDAGDLTIYGIRGNVLVKRIENGTEVIYRVDMQSLESVLKSPVYYLQQNDVVYVEPNMTKARQSTPLGNTVLTPSFWISVASLLTTITALLIK